jgi:hypothetical protein
MNVTMHPSQWFHHEAMREVTMPSPHRLRQLLHDGTFWATVVLIAMICAAFILAIMSSGTFSNEPYSSFYVP